MKKSRLALKIILPLLIIALGIAGLRVMNKMKPTPQRKPVVEEGLLVDVMTVQTESRRIEVRATGTAQPAHEIQLVPQVSGKVDWLSPRLVTGGFFRRGETLLKIDERDYQLAVDRARADIATAEVALATEQERAKVARGEWQRINLPDKGKPGPLVTRELQIRQQQASLAAARANLRQAELNLERTTLTAPFSARISQEQVDLGQYLRAGSSIATLAGSARAEIHLPLPLDDLKWLEIPTPRQPAGSPAIIRVPGSPQSWSGRIVRRAGEIDATSRMATVVVAVNDPYGLQSDKAGAPLAHGQFVEARLQGTALTDIFSIPRRALRPDSIVWTVTAQNRLQLQPVEVLYKSRDEVLIESGLSSGDRVVLTTISGAADGMPLRPVEQGPSE
jgi:RND family efflux transporter MFP subunit